MVHNQVNDGGVPVFELLKKVRDSGLIDVEWYLDNFPDVAVLGMDPVVHYLWIGQRLGRSPSPTELPGTDLMALLGLDIGKDPSFVSKLLFDGSELSDMCFIDRPKIAEFYNGPISEVQKVQIQSAQNLAILSSDLHGTIFDAEWYWRANADVRDSGLCLWTHYTDLGKKEGRQPNSYFSPEWYLSKYPDVRAARLNPVDHYVSFGFSENRSVGPNFDQNFYKLQLREDLDVSVDPLAHFLNQSDRNSFLANPSQIKSKVLIDRIGQDQSLDDIDIAIGIVAYKHRPDEIRSLLDSIFVALKICNDRVSAKVHIFDNGMTLKTCDLSDGVLLKSNGRNDGFGRSHNALMAEAFQAGAECYIGVNPDGALHPDTLVNLLKMSQRHDHAALIEAVQFPEEHPKYYHPEWLSTEWCSGACYLLPKKIWEETGGFDANIFLYCEDVDLSWMARYCGFETLVCPTAYFYHDVSDREYSPRIWKEMLVAGRYLARKWDCIEFERFAEERLLLEGFYDSPLQMPDLTEVKVIKDATKIVDFSKMFSFAKVRW